MERIKRLSGHLTANQTFKAVSDPGSDDYSLAAKDLFSMEGKVCVVTGGSRGIGKMFSAGYMANGATVIITSRKADVVQETVTELTNKYKEHGGKIIGIPGDLSTYEGVVKFVEDLKKVTNKVHVLINNAGATWGSSFGEFPDKAWPRVMDLNVRHVFNLTQLLIPLLDAGSSPDDPARVINISSAEGVRAGLTFGSSAAFSYSASKAAVIHMTKGLTRAFAQDDHLVTVNCICPGVFPSNMSKELMEMDMSGNPMRRMGRTADMVATALYLSSSGGSYTNGAVITVDGGGHLMS